MRNSLLIVVPDIGGRPHRSSVWRTCPSGSVRSVRLHGPDTHNRGHLRRFTAPVPEIFYGDAAAVGFRPVQRCNGGLHRLRRHLHHRQSVSPPTARFRIPPQPCCVSGRTTREERRRLLIKHQQQRSPAVTRSTKPHVTNFSRPLIHDAPPSADGVCQLCQILQQAAPVCRNTTKYHPQCGGKHAPSP